MILNLFFLILVLSLESTLALPVFFTYWSLSFFFRYQKTRQMFILFGFSLALAIFYNLSWPLLAAGLLIFHLFYSLWQKYSANNFLIKALFFTLILLTIFFLAKLHWHYFYLVQISGFLFYFYRSNFKGYAN